MSCWRRVSLIISQKYVTAIPMNERRVRKGWGGKRHVLDRLFLSQTIIRRSFLKVRPLHDIVLCSKTALFVLYPSQKVKERKQNMYFLSFLLYKDVLNRLWNEYAILSYMIDHELQFLLDC